MARSLTASGHNLRITSPTNNPGSVGTVAIRVKPNWNYNDGANHKLFWFCADDTSDPDRLQYQKFTDNNVYVGWYHTGTDHRIAVAAAATMFTSGTWQDHVFTWSDSADTEEYFTGGVSRATRTSALTTYVVGGNATLGNSNGGATQTSFDGSLADFAQWSVILTAGEIAAYHAGVDPRQIRPESLTRYAPLDGNNSTEPDLVDVNGWTVTSAGKDSNPRRFMPKRRQVLGIAAAGGAPTAALTNNLATTSQGTVTPALSLATTGNAATSSQGAVTPGISLALTGNSATASQGTPVAALSLALTGNAATASAGTVSLPGGVTLTGNAATATQGTVSPGITIALTGNGATASVGTVGKAISLALSGLAGTSAAGIVVPGLSLALSGNAGTSAVGSVGVSGSPITVALSGNAATASAGSVSVLSATFVGNQRTLRVPPQIRAYTVAPQDRTFTA